MAILNRMCLTRFDHLDLKFPIFLSQYACCNFLSQYAYYCDVQYACSIYCDAIVSFLLNKKGLESMSILHKKLCNMHIAHRNMHIAIESILPLTHTRVGFLANKLLRNSICHWLLTQPTPAWLVGPLRLFVDNFGIKTTSMNDTMQYIKSTLNEH